MNKIITNKKSIYTPYSLFDIVVNVELYENGDLGGTCA